MHKKTKFENMTVLIEFLVGAGLGLFFHWVLDYKEAAYIIFGVGVLLSLMTYLLREELEKVYTGLTKSYKRSHEIIFALAAISDPECRAKAEDILNVAKKTIEILQQGYIPLSETEFWLEAARAVDSAHIRIRSVDPLNAGWDSRGAMVNFYKANLHALERRTTIMRVFIAGREEFLEPEAQRILTAQLKDGVDVRLAYRDELSLVIDSTSIGNMSSHFAVYDDCLVTDVLSTPGHHYGRKTTQPAEVSKYLRALDIIEHNAYRISLEDEKIKVSCGAPIDVTP
jgi:hypothetical protein